MKSKYKFNPDEFEVHQKIINWVFPGQKVLDVGCASGYLAKELIKRHCRVTGIEIDPLAVHKAEKFCNTVIVGDIENDKIRDKLNGEKFSVIILADVIEHLKSPEATLISLMAFLDIGGQVIISVPNIAFVTNRLSHLLGNFDYSDWGIIDKTHLHFFTKKTIFELIKKAGLNVVRFDYVANFTQLPFFMQTFYPILGKQQWWRKIEYKIGGLWSSGLAVQFILLCQKMRGCR